MRKFLSFLVAFSFIVIPACSSIKTQTKYHDHITFANMNSYRIIPPKGVSMDIDNDHVSKRYMRYLIYNAIQKELGLKGFKNHRKGKADFYVYYTINVEEKDGINRLKYFTDLRDYGSPEYTGSEYKNYGLGTVILKVVNPKTSKAMWKGLARAEFPVDISKRSMKRKMNKSIKKVLKKFPPQ